MRRPLILTLIPLILILALAPAASAASAAGTGAEAAVQARRFVLLPNPASPFVSFQFWIAAGSACDPAGREGLAQLTGSLVGRGATQARGYDAILRELFPMAAGYRVSVDREMTVLQGTVHRDHAGAYYALLRDALLAPAFAEEDFARLRTDQINALETDLRYGDDEELAKAVLHWAAYAGTPYAHPEMGLVKSVRAITPDDVRAFHTRHYTRDNIVVGLAGCFDETLVARIRADLETLPPGPAPACPLPPAGRSAPGLRVFIVEKETPATTICFGHGIGITRAGDDFYPLMIANSWLGEHRTSSSHLYQVMRGARGMNYGDYSYIEWFDHGGWHSVPPPHHARHRQMFEVWIRPVVNAQRHFALRLALREVERLVSQGLAPDEFALTRNYLLDFSLNYAPTEAARLGYAIDDRFYALPEGHLARIQSRVASAKPEDVGAALRRHIRPGDVDIVFVTHDAEGLRQALVANAPSPIAYASATPEAILAEDRIIQDYPLAISPESVRIIPLDEVFAR